MNKQELKAKVAQRLITLRTQHGYSQQKVASLLGVSLTTYRNWELGKTLSDIKKIHETCA